ncbi:MAG: hypothetical protein AAF211_33945, partial [Myxococcota bacterium]
DVSATTSQSLGEPVRERRLAGAVAAVDGFHRPRAERYRRGRDSAEGCYRDTFDEGAVRRFLLDPLGARGNRRVRCATFDWRTDRPVASPPRTVPDDAVLVFDGVFAQRFADSWDLTIALRVSFEEALRRMIVRDDATDVQRYTDRFWKRYAGAQRRYRAEHSPEAAADIVIDNEDVQMPRALHLVADRVHSTDWQCVVDVFRHRVVKRPKSVDEIVATLCTRYPRFATNPERARAEAVAMVEAFHDGRAALRDSTLPRELVGAPRFLADGGYVQRRATVAKDVVRDATTEEATAFLEAYFDLVEELWSHGIHELTGNLMCNGGVDAGGRAILLDFGELSTDPAAIRADLAGRRWERSETYTVDLPEGLRPTFAELARTRWTVDNFDRHWHRASRR